MDAAIKLIVERAHPEQARGKLVQRKKNLGFLSQEQIILPKKQPPQTNGINSNSLTQYLSESMHAITIVISRHYEEFSGACFKL